MSQRRAPFPDPGHDHSGCVAEVVDRAARQGVRLTPLRETVLRELASSHRALGAYEVIDRLAASGRRVAPISIYRVLNALVEAGFAHRLESRNAYFACYGRHAESGPPIFLVCEQCGAVAETETAEVARSIGGIASKAGFRLSRPVLELTGVCSHCAASA